VLLLKEATIIGAGISGLTSAYTLAKSGYKVRLFEKSGFIGGRSRILSREGYFVDAGAQLLGENYHHTFNLIKELGLENQLVRLEEPIASLYLEGSFYTLDFRGILKSKKLSLHDKWLIYKMFKNVEKIDKTIDLTFTNINTERRFEHVSIADWVKENLNEDILEYFIQPSITALTLIDPEELSAFYGLLLLTSDMKDSFTLKRGVGSITLGLYNKLMELGVDITKNCEVTSIDLSNRGFEIKYTKEKEVKNIESANVILSTPSFVTSKLTSCLPEETKSALLKVKYSIGIQIIIGLKKKIWNKSWGILIPRSEIKGVAIICEPTLVSKNFAPRNNGLIEIFIYGATAKDLLQKNKKDILDIILKKIDGIFPCISENIVWYDILKWENALPIFTPDFHMLRNNFKTNIKSLELAGDYLYPPSIESAVYSGIKAAQNIKNHGV